MKKILLLKRQYFKTGLFCQKPCGSHVAEPWLDVTTVHLNSRLHIQGLRCEIWRQYNQFTHEQVPVSDMQHIIAKHTNRQRMPWLIEAFGSCKFEVVYMKSDWYASQGTSLPASIESGVSLRNSLVPNSTIVQNQIIWVLRCIRSRRYDEGDFGSTLASLLC